jgi:hypothetical protein
MVWLGQMDIPERALQRLSVTDTLTVLQVFAELVDAIFLANDQQYLIIV